MSTYKIGEAASLLNLKTYVLRFWETEFPQIAPLRTEKGQRLYTEENVALLRRIRHLLHERGLTIEGARRILAEEGARPGAPLAGGNGSSATHAPDLLSLFGADDATPDDGADEPEGKPAFRPSPFPSFPSFGQNSPVHISAGFEPGGAGPGHVESKGAPSAEERKELLRLQSILHEVQEELEDLTAHLRRNPE